MEGMERAERVEQLQYYTVRKGYRVTAEVEDRRSRFIGLLAHVEGEREAQELIEACKAKHRDARHHVFAWLLADGRERVSDDGEPHGTAGLPVLDVLRGANCKDVCCVVTRYFGGVLLGTGGLTRAYAGTATKALEQARADGTLACMTLVRKVVIQLPYSLYERVRHMVECSGGNIVDSLFQEDVQLTAVFRDGEELSFVQAMHELAAGDELCRVSEATFAEF